MRGGDLDRKITGMDSLRLHFTLSCLGGLHIDVLNLLVVYSTHLDGLLLSHRIPCVLGFELRFIFIFKFPLSLGFVLGMSSVCLFK